MNIKNAIVLVEQIDLEAKTGKKPLDAVCLLYTSSTEEEFARVVDYLSQRVWHILPDGDFTLGNVLSKARELVHRHGCLLYTSGEQRSKLPLNSGLWS